MELMITACIGKEDPLREKESINWLADIIGEDYVEFALWDITDTKNVIKIMNGDSYHEPIGQMINSFVEGIKYVDKTVIVHNEKILFCDDENKPEFDWNNLLEL